MWFAVGDECEAYLAGRLAAHLQARHQAVPPVGWLNQPLELELLADPAAIDLDPADLIRLTLGRLFELPGLSA